MKTLNHSFVFGLQHFASAQRRDITFEHYSTQNGLSHYTVKAMAQDRSGFMWFGTEEGLNQFDGYSFKVFKSKEGKRNSLSENIVHALLLDRSNNLWIGTNSGGLNRYKAESENFECYKNFYNSPDSAAINNVNSIAQDKEGNLWVGCEDGLAKFDPKTALFVQVFNKYSTNQIPGNNVSCLLIDGDILWIGTQFNGLVQMNIKTLAIKSYIFETIRPNLVNNMINCMIKDKLGFIWIGSVNGLYRFNPQTGEKNRFEKMKNNPSSLAGNEVTSIFQDTKGQIWVGSHNGLSLYNPEKNNFIKYQADLTNPNSLSDNCTYSIFEDKFGQIWLGGETHGLNKFNNRTKQFRHYFHQADNVNSLSNNTVRKIYEDNEGKLWVGIFNGGLDIIDRQTNKYTHYANDASDANSISDNRVCSILKDSHKNKWIGTWGGGLDKLVETSEGAKFIHFKHDPNNPKSLSDNVVMDIFEDKWGRLWIGSKQGLDLFDSKKGEFANFSSQKGNPNSLIENSIQSGCILQDQYGNLWVGSWGGLTMIKLTFDSHLPAKYYRYKQDRRNQNSLSENHVISLHFDKAHNLWVGTFGGGLNKMIFDKHGLVRKVLHYTEHNGLPNNIIYNIQEDEHQNLWLSTNKGISKFDPDTERFSNYDVADGLQSNEFYWGAGCKSKTGEILFGGINGLNSFFPDSIKADKTMPQAVMTGFRIFNEKVDVGPNSKLKTNITYAKQILLDYNDKVISFEFSVLHYDSPEKNRYAYQLEGFDKQWIYTDSKNRLATYTNLDPGKYTFRVKGCSSDGVWTEKTANVIIIIKPPFWGTWWFRIAGSILIIASVYTRNKLKIKRLRLQKKLLEMKVTERTAELRDANYLLKERQDEILQQNEEIHQQSEELIVQRDALSDQNKYIVEQNKLITEKNDQINASIRYALTIQQAMLPPDRLIHEKFNCFIFYKPKDIVSGDFYWISEIYEDENKKENLIALADCTGHGVPGAFMSMLCINLLNEITHKNVTAFPSEILEAMDAGIKRTLRQNLTENQDGLEIIVCRITQNADKTTKICFSGSKINLIHHHAALDRMEVYKSDRRIIGGMKHISDHPISFGNTNVDIQPNDSIYISSDGIIDQNNPARKRFGTRSLVSALHRGSSLGMEEQKQLLETRLEHWKQSESQRDDITVWGIKF